MIQGDLSCILFRVEKNLQNYTKKKKEKNKVILQSNLRVANISNQSHSSVFLLLLQI